MADIILSSYRKRTIPPCKGCTQRTVECHSTCEDYIEWAKVHNTERAAAKRKRGAELLVEDYTIGLQIKKRKRRNTK